MKKIFLLNMVLCVVVAAGSSFVDSDTDGVPDKRDKCLSTPFFDLVDSSGCTVKTLAVKTKYAKSH